MQHQPEPNVVGESYVEYSTLMTAKFSVNPSDGKIRPNGGFCLWKSESRKSLPERMAAGNSFKPTT